jgi:septal ring factor EnvC (AmiA/AmiB activator)
MDPNTTTSGADAQGADASQELTPAQLKKQLAAVTKERDTATTKLEKVTAERDELKRKNAEQAEELAQAEQVIGEQTEKLAVADAKGGDAVIVTHERKQYRVIGKQLNVDGHVHTAESLTKNPDVVAALVRSESGFLQLVSK